MSDPTEAAVFPGGSILVVDDNAANLIALAALLDPLGNRVVCASSGAEALARLEEEEFAVVLLDAQMPGLDGFETAKLIRAKETTREVPIVFVTAAYRDDEHATTAYQAGAIDYLMKPIDPDVVRAKARGFVGIARRTARLRKLDAELRAREHEAATAVGAAGAAPATGTVPAPLDPAVSAQHETERAELLEREQTARRRAESAERRTAFLARATEALAASLDVNESLAAFARMTIPDFADTCMVYLRDDDGRPRMVAAAAADPERQAFIDQLRAHPARETAETPAARVMRTHEAEWAREASSEWLAGTVGDAERLRVFRAITPRSFIMVPLIVRGTTLGSVAYGFTEPERRYEGGDVPLAQELARRAAIAVDHARAYEAIERASRLKDDFLATISHELRTPLQAILMWSSVLTSRDPSPDALARGLAAIRRSAMAQAVLVDDVLDVSRIVTGKLRLEMRPLDANPLIAAAVDALRPTADARDIALTLTLPQGASPVNADPARLRQIVWNLVSNAIKFTPRRGHVAVEVRENAEHVRIEVRDSGEGIPLEFLPHMFERFRQADGSVTRRHGGLGLGLAIVRHLVELHGGAVSVASEGLGHGATFSVLVPSTQVPVVPAADGVLADDGRITPIAARALEDQRVLLSGESAGALTQLCEALEGAGAFVRIEAAGTDAIEKGPPFVPAALICRVERDGEAAACALLRTIRARAAEFGERTQALAIVPAVISDQRRALLVGGFQGYLTDPVEQAELVAAVANLIGGATR